MKNRRVSGTNVQIRDVPKVTARNKTIVRCSFVKQMNIHGIVSKPMPRRPLNIYNSKIPTLQNAFLVIHSGERSLEARAITHTACTRAQNFVPLLYKHYKYRHWSIFLSVRVQAECRVGFAHIFN